MHWLKQHSALTLGVGLPAVLAALFLAVQWVPRLFVDPPRYEVLYLSGYDPEYTSLRYTVEDGHVEFYFYGDSFGQLPQLYLFSPASGEAREIAIPTPKLPPAKTDEEAEKRRSRSIPVSVPEAEKLTLNESKTAPDGYALQYPNRRPHGSMVAVPLFADVRDAAALVKEGNVVPLPASGAHGYYGYDYGHGRITFVGWVMP